MWTQVQDSIHHPNNTTQMMLIIADIAIGCSEFNRNIFIRFQNMKCAVDCGVPLVACIKHKKRGSLGARWMRRAWERMRGVGVRESMLLVVRSHCRPGSGLDTVLVAVWVKVYMLLPISKPFDIWVALRMLKVFSVEGWAKILYLMKAGSILVQIHPQCVNYSKI
jgi:hypothetical protein